MYLISLSLSYLLLKILHTADTTRSMSSSMTMILFTQGLKTAIIEGHEIGGTCVNRGCVPSKALLAASGRVRDLKNDMHLKSLGIQVYLVLLGFH